MRVPLPAAMMTTSSAMQIPDWIRNRRIIGARPWALCLLAAALLAACSTVRFAYTQAPDLAYWWADGYVDFTEDQTPKVRDDIARWFAWHRQTQLPRYAQALSEAQREVTGDTDATQACRWWDQVVQWRNLAFEHALPAMADNAARLQPQQIQNLQRRYEKNNRDFRREYLQGNADDRQERNVKRAIERAEMVYGRLDAEQRKWVAQKVAASPFDPQVWLAERMRRQQDMLQVVRGLQQSPAGQEQALAAMRGYYLHLLDSPDERYRAYSAQLTSYNCDFAAQLHNRTTPAQRLQAVEKFKGWEADLRALVANGGNAN